MVMMTVLANCRATLPTTQPAESVSVHTCQSRIVETVIDNDNDIDKHCGTMEKTVLPRKKTNATAARVDASRALRKRLAKPAKRTAAERRDSNNVQTPRHLTAHEKCAKTGNERKARKRQEQSHAYIP